MTREEAIYRLKNMAWLYGSVEREQNIEAIDMAIDALKFTEHFDLLKEFQSLQEVVRCKDCRWYEPKYKDKEYDCPQGLYAVYADDYCSHAERREP